jgi:hypothetical protein
VCGTDPGWGNARTVSGSGGTGGTSCSRVENNDPVEVVVAGVDGVAGPVDCPVEFEPLE